MGIEDILSAGMEQAQDIPAEPKDQSGDFPPKLERDPAADVQAPKLERDPAGKGHDMSFGESFDSMIARHKLERAIEHGNKIAAEHRAEDWRKVLEKEEAKKEAREAAKKNK